jgi:hypothetical protein
MTIENPSGNGVQLYVLADKRLLLVRSHDPNPTRLLVSTSSDWTNLNSPQATLPGGLRTVSANRDGIVFTHYDEWSVPPAGDANRDQFSTDLTNWQNIALPDD